jgi:hypothetical protein
MNLFGKMVDGVAKSTFIMEAYHRPEMNLKTRMRNNIADGKMKTGKTSDQTSHIEIHFPSNALFDIFSRKTAVKTAVNSMIQGNGNTIIAHISKKPRKQPLQVISRMCSRTASYQLQIRESFRSQGLITKIKHHHINRMI